MVESQRVSDILAEEYAEAVCRRAEELVTELRDTSSPLDSSLLRLTLHCSFLYVMPGFYMVTFSRSCTFAVLNISVDLPVYKALILQICRQNPFASIAKLLADIAHNCICANRCIVTLPVPLQLTYPRQDLQ